MQKNYDTLRLTLDALDIADSPFIFELVNTAEWKRFIGERHINSLDDAKAYTQRIMDNGTIRYWVVRSKELMLPIGVITLIQRDYLPHPDIGFAFLPAHGKKGFAFEAAHAILADIINSNRSNVVMATTIEDNYNSIQLLEKLGLSFNEKIIKDGETLLLYAVTADKIKINKLIRDFFSIFNNCGNKKPNWDMLRAICIPQTIIIKKTGSTETVYSLESFIEPREKILNDGSLVDFKEKEIKETTMIIGNIAQRYSRYEKDGYLNKNYFKEQGHKFFQCINTNEGWKINALIWEDDAAT